MIQNRLILSCTIKNLHVNLGILRLSSQFPRLDYDAI